MIEKSFASARKFLSVLFAFTLISLSSFAQDISTDAAAIKDGEALFNANCKACHRVKQKLVGPALEHVYDRAPSIQWIKDFVHNSSAVIASGDDYAVKLYNEYNKTQMTAFSGLKDEQIMNILAYIKAQDTAPVVGGGDGGGETKVVQVDNTSSKYLNIILIGMLLILILLVVILGFLISSLRRFLDQKQLTEEDKDIVNPTTTSSTMLRSKALLFIVVFVCAGLGFKAVVNGLYSIGVQQGYAPKQPIAFSHKIHAGDMEIDCKYCHTGVLKGRSATIPSTNICMNCHNQIKAGAQTGESQIAQILKSYNENEPIQWVRVHNLPDLAYFNHAQHVNVGGVECQTCHGPVQEMEVVRQHSLLTMGWCIDCHRKTDVNTKGNAYYDKLVELHKQKKGEKAPYKVEDIGGLECSKCHY
jgi:mono/diheme cytochrome c family protein